MEIGDVAPHNSRVVIEVTGSICTPSAIVIDAALAICEKSAARKAKELIDFIVAPKCGYAFYGHSLALGFRKALAFLQLKRAFP
jgi:hypothetical protein